MVFLFNGGAEIFISAVFLIVVATIVISIVKGLQTWKKNNESPRLSVEAVVAAKRAEVHTFHQPNAGDATGIHGYTTTTNTTYYVCFQFETGDRLELRVSGREYGMIAEGDRGKLTFQGSRYLDFERKEI